MNNLRMRSTDTKEINLDQGTLRYLWAQVLSCVQLFATPLSVAHQAPLSRRFPRQEYWSELPFSPPGDLPDPGTEPVSPASHPWPGGFFTNVPLCVFKILNFKVYIFREIMLWYYLLLSIVFYLI